MNRSTMHLVSTDTLNWSHPSYSFRVRLEPSQLPDLDLADDSADKVLAQMRRTRSFLGLLQSNTKAKRFHGYLEGDYTMATFGFYTNNLNGVKRLYQKYPELFVSVQRYDQYLAASELAKLLTDTE